MNEFHFQEGIFALHVPLCLGPVVCSKARVKLEANKQEKLSVVISDISVKGGAVAW